MRPIKWTDLIANEKNITVCKLDDGQFVEYDVCGDTPDAYASNIFELIGHGVFYSWNGIVQEVQTPYYFFRKKGRTK